MRAFLFLSLIVITGCAQRMDEIDERTESIHKRIAALENRTGMPAGSDRELLEGQKLADTRSQVLALRNEITVLSGKIEALEYEQKATTNRVNMIAQEFEKRTSRQVVPAAVPSSEEDASPESRDYQTALRAHQDGDFQKAQKLFEDFMNKYRRSNYRDNALYWLGEGHLADGQYRKAIIRFQDLIENYPKSDKRCAALEKQIVCLNELKMGKEAQVFSNAYKKECSDSRR